MRYLTPTNRRLLTRVYKHSRRFGVVEAIPRFLRIPRKGQRRCSWRVYSLPTPPPPLSIDGLDNTVPASPYAAYAALMVVHR